MKLGNYLNKNKIGGLILIIVIIIAFGFGGFGGGFLSNNQNNIAKINKTNITSQDLIEFINRSGIAQETIQKNLNNNVIEELLTGLVSNTLLALEIEDFGITISKSSLSEKIKNNNNFQNENRKFERIKYEKFLLENNISAPLFEKRLKDRESQKKLFDYIGAGSVSPQFLVKKLYENENKKLNINFVDLNTFYKKNDEITEKDLLDFIDENKDQLKVEYIDFKYALVNPQNLIGISEYNQEFFDKIDQIENNILNGVEFDTITSDLNLNVSTIYDYKYSEKSDEIQKKIYEVRNNSFDIFENKENFIIYKIENLEKKKPNLDDDQTKKEILELVAQKSKFDYNKNLLEKIQNKEFTEQDFFNLGKDKIESLKLNSIKDNNKFEINSVQILYSLPLKSITLINDEKNNIYLAKINNYDDLDEEINPKDYEKFSSKENTEIRNNILKSYDLFLNQKYDVDINQVAINNVKNLFQ
ncbi:SurA N-terminal domain-containing protein [Candidatus Pelagibacter communis]|uniref:SurA N-terminal domain-containing protein n=1 Tax=Candidatus Pelagibacter TaxID=198251 RepID=UPI003EE27FD5